MAVLPLDERIRQLWKDTAMSAAENCGGMEAVTRADTVTIAFINRFYPNNMEAGNHATMIHNAVARRQKQQGG